MDGVHGGLGIINFYEVNRMEKLIDKKLFELCKLNKVDQLENLSKIITDFNIEDDTKKTPLMYACEYGHLEIVDILLRKGADINKTSLSNLNAVQYAEKNNYIDIVYKLLIDEKFGIRDLNNIKLIKTETLKNLILMYIKKYHQKIKHLQSQLNASDINVPIIVNDNEINWSIIGTRVDTLNNSDKEVYITKRQFKTSLLFILVEYKNKQNGYLPRINILIELLKHNVHEIIQLDLLCKFLFTTEEIHKLKQDNKFFDLLLENNINITLFYSKQSDIWFWIITIISFFIFICILV